jgi:hypothetical protein
MPNNFDLSLTIEEIMAQIERINDSITRLNDSLGIEADPVITEEQTDPDA